MKKDIYIIKNKINDKVYVGQAYNSAIRWSGHKSSAKLGKKKITIDQAMHDLGVDNFWYEIIETVENYDERERYWISYYNCQVPNGYNYLAGGDGAQGGVNSANAIIRNQDIIDAIMNDLSFTDIKMKDLATKYEVSLKIISAINRGTAYQDHSRFYPLRARAADKIDDVDYESIMNDLMYTSIGVRKLAEIHHTSEHVVRQINLGNKFFDDTKVYPLRQKDDSKVLKVKELLKTTTLSMHEIAIRCNISYSMVATINTGKYHHDDTIDYPIRKTTL